MTADDVVDILARLGAADIEFWVEGGWGVDALLGEQTRPHQDLDLAVRLEDVDRIVALFAEFERSDDEWPASFVLRDANGRTIDCHPLTFDERGDGWQANAEGGPPYRWPRDDLQARGRISGVELPCISPKLQLRWHSYAGAGEVARRDVRLLRDRFVVS